MAKVLIATLYKPDPVLIASNRFGPDKLILLIDTKTNTTQKNSYQLIQQSIGRVVKVKQVKTEVYDIVKIAEKCVKIIDEQSDEDQIYVNITSGRKTQAFGLLFAAYARSDRVKKIAYNPEEGKKAVIWLPKISFNLNESQKKVLAALGEKKYSNIPLTDIAKKIGMSRAMLYKCIKELTKLGYIAEDKRTLTDEGRIARL